MTDGPRALAIINALALFVALVVNSLATSLPLNGQTPSEIAARFSSYYIPADFTFGIWGPIYLALIAFVVYPFLPQQRGSPALERIGWLFVVNCLANAAWIVLWHYEYFELSPLVMVTMLGSAAAIYLRLDIGRAHTSARDWWMLHMPISLYLGWLCVATISNISCVLEVTGWSGWGLAAEDWMLIMLGITGLLAFVTAWQRRDAVILMVLTWALAGIAVKHADAQAVATASYAVAGLLILLLVMMAFGWRRQAMQLPADG